MEAAGLARMELEKSIKKQDLSKDDKEEYKDLFGELSRYMEGRDINGKKIDKYTKIVVGDLENIIKRTEDLIKNNV